MEWKELGNEIAKEAPQLGALLGSLVPGAGTAVGGAVGLGVKAILNMFGLGDNASPEEVLTAIKQDPASALKLKMAEMDFELKSRQLDIDTLKQEQSTYIEELRDKTIPWVDALHKMGRQIHAVLVIGVTVLLMLTGHDITSTVALLIGGPPTAYTLIKGKGNQK